MKTITQEFYLLIPPLNTNSTTLIKIYSSHNYLHEKKIQDSKCFLFVSGFYAISE